jgi:hypothetical protein
MALILKRASASRPPGEWNDDDFHVLADGVVGRIMKAAATLGGHVVDVDGGVRLSRKPPANARLRGHTRGRDGGVPRRLAVGMKAVLAAR